MTGRLSPVRRLPLFLRSLLPAAAALLLPTDAPGVRAATAFSGAIPAIPPELQYARVPLAAEDNAVTAWLQAAPMLKPLDEPAKTRVRVAWTPGAKAPPAEDWAPVAAWRRENAGALRLIEDSLRRPKAQWPVRSPEDFEPGLAVMRLAAIARLAQAHEACERGEPVAAADLILGTVRFGHLAADGEGALIHYLVGAACRSLGHQAAQRFAALADPTPPALRRLLDGLPALDDEPEVYARVLRAEFTDYILKAADAVAVATQWTEALRKDAATMNLLLPEHLQRPTAVFLTPSLVVGHPQPWDHAADVREALPRFLRYLRNARADWQHQEADPDDAALTQASFLEAAREVLEPVAEETLPLSREAADRIRPAYNAFVNPVGRVLAARPDVVDFSARRIFQARVEREATRTLLALRLHRIERGHWPVRLEELVEARLLPTPPRDAFSGGLLRYDRARLVLWSVGADGRDDGGTSSSEGRWQQDDAVWKIFTNE